VTLGDNPDVCVVNTCTVTAKSDYQSRQLIRRAGRAGAKVIVTGCYSELNREKAEGMEGVQAVVENANKINIINMIGSNTKRDKPLVRRGRTRGRTRHFLKVQDGCNNSCSYCIVHIARGASKSVTPDKIIENVKRAVDSGYREVVLTGIHLGQYGTDLGGGAPVSGLVEDILEKTSVERLRLSSLEVNEIDDRLLGLFKNPRLMPHLHIPLQSGDDETLKLMNRAYDTAFFRETVKRVHERLPEIALGTDIIAGFPSETNQAFENTMALAEELPFTYMHIFPYSRRPGTPAAGMEDIVGPDERKRRAKALRDLSQSKNWAYLNRQVGKTLEVLLEETVKDGTCLGTSSNYLKVEVPCDARMCGTIAPIRIAGVREGRLVGELSNTQEAFDFIGKTVCTKPAQ
jgi:threonylcarbamoyladenosine tRNA methylthiotransferase MtaB